MNIEVKGTKQETAQPDGARRYESREREENSRTPLGIGLVLSALALYFKSIFPAHAARAEMVAGEPAGPSGDAAPAALTVVQPVSEEIETEPVAPVDFHNNDFSAPMERSAAPGLMDVSVASRIDAIFEFPNTFGDALVEVFADGGQYAANDNLDLDRSVSASSAMAGAGADGDSRSEDNEPDGDSGPDSGAGSNPSNDGTRDDEAQDSGELENRTPRTSGPVYLMDVASCAVLAVGLSDLVRNASDPDGDTLSVGNVTVSSGTIRQAGQGWVFQSDPQFTGEVVITYQISDGEFLIQQSASFSVLESQIDGTIDNAIVFSGVCGGSVDGTQGNDRVEVRSGDRAALSEPVDEQFVLGVGDDMAFGGSGEELVAGSAGRQQLSGNSGSDRLAAGSGDDMAFGGPDSDVVPGGEAADFVLPSIDGAGTDHFAGNEAISTALVTGARGNIFEFVQSAAETGPPAIQRILDFEVGDMIRVSKYDLFEEVPDDLEDQFEKIYGVLEDDGIAIRYRHDAVEEITKAVVEVDLSKDDAWGSAFCFEGEPMPVMVENL